MISVSDYEGQEINNFEALSYHMGRCIFLVHAKVST